MLLLEVLRSGHILQADTDALAIKLPLLLFAILSSLHQLASPAMDVIHRP